MTKPPEFLARLVRAALLALTMVLSACGPGSGGTGTGPVMGVVTFSGVAGLGTVGVGSPSTPTTGVPAGCVDCPQVDLQLQDGAVELATACGRFVFNGDWEVREGRSTLPGRFDASGRPAVAATLQLLFGDGSVNSQAVTATVVDAAGAVLLGPVTLQRTASTPAARTAVSCP
jgi:hypothetical protein